jgi:hypothetical protein
LFSSNHWKSLAFESKQNNKKKIGAFYSLYILISCHTCNCPKWHCATSIFVVHLICPNGPNGYYVIVPKWMEWQKKLFAFAMLLICDWKSKTRCFNKTGRILGHTWYIFFGCPHSLHGYYEEHQISFSFESFKWSKIWNVKFLVWFK